MFIIVLIAKFAITIDQDLEIQKLMKDSKLVSEVLTDFHHWSKSFGKLLGKNKWKEHVGGLRAYFQILYKQGSEQHWKAGEFYKRVFAIPMHYMDDHSLCQEQSKCKISNYHVDEKLKITREDANELADLIADSLGDKNILSARASGSILE